MLETNAGMDLEKLLNVTGKCKVIQILWKTN